MDLPHAPVTYALIITNLIVSLYAWYVDHDFIDTFKFEVHALAQRGQHYRVFSSSFLHNDLFHLLFNMMALFSFGPYVENTLGRTGFMVVYFGAILASGILSFFLNRKDGAYSSLGASDAVSGVIFSYILFNPLNALYFLFLPVPIPAILFGAFFIVLSSVLMNRENRRVAHEGHLGGAIAGVVLTIVMIPASIGIFFEKLF